MIPVLVHGLRDLRRGIIGWGLGIVALVAIMASVWPSMQGIEGLDDMLASYPEPMRELFNIEAFTTGTGFLNAELFSFMLPMLFAIFGISRGAALLATKEEQGTMEVVWAQPVARWRILLGSAMALSAAIALLGGVLLVSMWIADGVANLGVGFGALASGSVSMVLFGIEFGLLSLAVGAATGRRGMAIGVASVTAIAAWLLYVLSKLVEAFDGWQVLSPVEHALRDGPLGTGWAVGSLLAMMLVAAAVTLAATPILDRRDIRG